MVLALDGDSTMTSARPVPFPPLGAALLAATSLLLVSPFASPRRHSVACPGTEAVIASCRACRRAPRQPAPSCTDSGGPAEFSWSTRSSPADVPCRPCGAQSGGRAVPAWPRPRAGRCTRGVLAHELGEAHQPAGAEHAVGRPVHAVRLLPDEGSGDAGGGKRRPDRRPDRVPVRAAEAEPVAGRVGVARGHAPPPQPGSVDAQAGRSVLAGRRVPVLGGGVELLQVRGANLDLVLVL